MAIAPINYATIQRTADIETFKNQQDTKPMVDQQNIQVQVGSVTNTNTIHDNVLSSAFGDPGAAYPYSPS